MSNDLAGAVRGKGRRQLLGLGLAAAVLASAPLFAQEQQPLKFRQGSVQGEGVYNDGQKKFAKLVEERTGGKVQIEHFCCNQLGGERQIADGIKLGTIGIGALGATGSPILDLLFMPFLFRDRDHVTKVLNGPIGDKWAEDYYKATGVRMIGYVVNGPRNFETVKRQVRTPADLKGMKIRAPEIPVVVASLKALGASPVVIAFPELYTALQQGTAEGWEAPIAVMYDYKFWEVAKYLSIANWNYNNNFLVINDDIWKKMTPATQKIVKDTWKEVAAEISNNLANNEAKLIEEMKKKGVDVVIADPAPFREATKDVWKDFAPKIWGPGVYEAIQAVK